ncbi:MAG: hypothetical protein HY267_06755 [Deltaproteobacteria bacterium]|nr:hypothetical protein [Deltaproteobacteria bacterium]
MKNARASVAVFLVGAVCCWANVGCGTVTSLVPGLGEDKSTGPQVGEKVHFKISPEEAVAILAEIAPQHEWEVEVTGDQFDLQGFRGKFFRLLTGRFIGGPLEVNGVFFLEPGGTYAVVGKKDTGLPQALVEPFTAAVAERTGAAKEQTEAVKE